MITSKSVKFGYLCNDIITLRTVDYEIQENTQCDIKNQEEGYRTFFLTAFSDLAGTLTQDLRNRNPTLYTTKLRGLYNVKSENGNRKTTLNGERVSGIDFRFPFSPFRFFTSCSA